MTLSTESSRRLLITSATAAKPIPAPDGHPTAAVAPLVVIPECAQAMKRPRAAPRNGGRPQPALGGRHHRAAHRGEPGTEIVRPRSARSPRPHALSPNVL